MIYTNDSFNLKGEIKNELKMGDSVITLTWHETPVPRDLMVRQVYAVAFNKEGKVLLKVEEHKGKNYYSLAGGTPESFDNDLESTLRREYVEEVNTTLKDKIYYLGYQEVEGDKGLPAYAQVRTVALIDKIGAPSPDPDNGKIYKRVLVSPENAAKLLNWGTIGDRIMQKAARIVKTEFKLDNNSEEIEYI